MTPDAGGRYLIDLLGKPFSDEQLAVVTAPLGPQLVIAGAGSGKTTVMAARVVHAVAYFGVPASSVLGLTFTNKAATELAERVRRALTLLAQSRPPADSSDQQDADDMPTVSTYHAYAAQLVADHALRIGREPQTRLLSEAARWQIAMHAVRNARGPFEHLEWTTPFVAQYVLDLDGEMSEHLAGLADVRGADARIRAQVAGSADSTEPVNRLARVASQRDELLQIVEAFRARKRQQDVIDFGDQVALAAQIAESCPEVAATERQRFQVVFLDEYQDTGVGQRRLLTALFSGGHPVTAVGDPCQSIYGWRGASAGNLLRFPEHFARADGSVCAPQFLSTSFRNGSTILRAANVLSEPLRTASDGRPVLVEVPELAAAPTATSGELRIALHATIEDEARWLADEVAAQLEQGVRAREIAVLCRRRADFALLHQQLVARDVPVEVVGLAGLLTMPEVSDIVSVLDCIADPTANAALVRMLTGPRWRIGPRDLAALGRRAAELCDTGRRRVATIDDPDGTAALADATASVDPCDVVALSDALADPGDASAYSPEALSRFSALAVELTRLRRFAGLPVIDIVSRVISMTGLDVEIEASPSRVAAARAANIASFADHAARFESVDGESDLPSFLSYLAAAETAENGLDVGAVSTADTVKLLTVHKAKGLEWDVVAVPCLTDGAFPSSLGRSRWTEAARVLPFCLRGDRHDLPPDPEISSKGLKEFALQCREQDATEERRLAYVAATRARSLLIASGHRWSAKRSTVAGISPFLDELADVARSGGGSVAVWTEDPPLENPLLTREVPDVVWPAPLDPAALARRRTGADLVAAAMSAPAAASPPAAAPTRAAAPTPPPATGALDELTEAERRIVEQWTHDTDTLIDELARDATATRDVALPRTLTTSQVVALAEDEAAFTARLARPLPRKPSAVARRGTAFHAWVERRFDARPLFDPDDLPGAGDSDVPFDDEELERLRIAFANGPYGNVQPHAVEAPFELLVAGRLIRGRIDAVYATDGGFDVIDYKTGLKPRDMAAAAWQLAIYRLAWADLAGVPVESVTAGFLYVSSGELYRPDMLDRPALAKLLGDPLTVGDADVGVAGTAADAASDAHPLDAAAVAAEAPRIDQGEAQAGVADGELLVADPPQKAAVARRRAARNGGSTDAPDDQLALDW